MGLQESPSFDEAEKNKPAKKRLSQQEFRNMMMIAIALLGIGMMIVGAIQLGSQADTEVGGLDGCLFDGAGNPVIAEVIYGDQSKLSYDNGCFFFDALPVGNGQLTIKRGTDTWTYDIQIAPGQAVLMGEIILE
jgi:hypothetical protein